MKAKTVYPLIGIISFLLIWQFAAMLVDKTWLLPAPLTVLAAMGDNYGLLLRHSRYTLGEALLGLALSVPVALLLAMLLSLSERLRRMFYPLLLGSQMVPIIVLAPLFIIWFGYGMLPKVLVVILICFFPLVISALAGLNAVDAETLAYYRAMGMSRGQLFRLVRLPAALPYCFSGLRMAATYSVMGAVIGEWLGAAAGLGLLLTRAQRSYDLPLSFAAIVAIILLSALLCGAVIIIERRCLRWRYVANEEWRD